MFIKFCDKNGTTIVMKKTAIRLVESVNNDRWCTVRTTDKNRPTIQMGITVENFFDWYLAKKEK